MCSSDIFLSVAFSFLTISMTDPHLHNWKIDDSLCYLNHGDVFKRRCGNSGIEILCTH